MLATLRQLKDCHQRLAERTEALDWDAVLSEWQTAERLFADLRPHSIATLPAKPQAEARALMEEILATQRAMAARIGPWMEQVRPMLDAFARTSASSTTDSAA